MIFNLTKNGEGVKTGMPGHIAPAGSEKGKPCGMTSSGYRKVVMEEAGLESGFLPRLHDLLELTQIPRELFYFGLMLDTSNVMFLLRQQRIDNTQERE